MSSSVAPDDVSRRAYELWENEGRPEGCELRHWLQAEQELAQNRSASGNERNESGAGTDVPARNSDVNPLQGTRAAAAVNAGANRDNSKDKARATGTGAFSGERNGNGAGQNAGKRKPASAPAL